MLKDTTKINTKYDDILMHDIGLPWLPWVGIDFDESMSRTIILGESTYNWDPNNPQVQERINKNDHLRILHQNHAINPESKANFVRSIERAIFQTKKPTSENMLNFWNSVVYHNLVLRHMPTIKSRPQYDDYKEGWIKYLSLIDTIEARECLVYGIESKKYNSLIELLNEREIEYKYDRLPTKVGRSYPRIIEIKYMSHKILFIKHPSAFFNWQKWGEIIKENLRIADDNLLK